ncbi:hypothetical protein [Levilactobacillus brevis]|uniref:hypothetical protein n=1 Tax=Levilactobacillus brevis TaxID=1580 RepID=UPI0032615AB7
MNETEFDKKYAQFLDSFDDLFETEDNYKRIANDVSEEAAKNPNSHVNKEIAFEHQYQTERTNNLVRIALKNFLVSGKED